MSPSLSSSPLPSPAAEQYYNARNPSSCSSPFPTSAFSDYGSSQCSSATDCDPFEYTDHLSSPSPPSEDYNLFAAAVAYHSRHYTFVLPSFPPKRLVERRPDRFANITASAAASATPFSEPTLRHIGTDDAHQHGEADMDAVTAVRSMLSDVPRHFVAMCSVSGGSIGGSSGNSSSNSSGTCSSAGDGFAFEFGTAGTVIASR